MNSEEQIRMKCLELAKQSEPMADGDRVLELAVAFHEFIRGENGNGLPEPESKSKPK